MQTAFQYLADTAQDDSSNTPDSEKVENFLTELTESCALTPELLQQEKERLQFSDAGFVAWNFRTPFPALNTVKFAEQLIQDPQFENEPFPLFLIKAKIYESEILNYPPILGPAILFVPQVESDGSYKIHFLLDGNLHIIDGYFNPDKEVRMKDLLKLIAAVEKASLEGVLFTEKNKLAYVQPLVTPTALKKYLRKSSLVVSNLRAERVSDYLGSPLDDDTIAKLIEIGQRA